MKRFFRQVGSIFPRNFIAGNRSGAAWIGWTCFFAVLAGCKTSLPPGTLVLVNGQPITASDLKNAVALEAFHGFADTPAKIVEKHEAKDQQQALDGLIDQTLILQEGARSGVDLPDDDLKSQVEQAESGTTEAQLSQSLQQEGLSFQIWSDWIRRSALAEAVVRHEIRSRIVVTQQDLRDYYWEHVTDFRRSETVELSQIFCGKRSDIRNAMSELKLGEPFADVARRYSQSPEAARGGDLGWVERKELPHTLAVAAFALKPGKYSDVLRSAYGWHILYAQDRRPAQDFTLEQSAPQIEDVLLGGREQPLYQNWLADMRRKATIVHLEPIKETP